jgi:hypothetical protein
MNINKSTQELSKMALKLKRMSLKKYDKFDSFFRL